MSLKNPVTTPGIDPGTVRLVAQRLNHYASPGPKCTLWETKFTDAQQAKPARNFKNTKEKLCSTKKAI
jgi:hypothetical protein